MNIMNFKKRFISILIAVVTFIAIIPNNIAYAYVGEDFAYSYWGYSKGTTPIYANSSLSGNAQDELGAGEGFTIIGISGSNFRIEYGTPSGFNRGWVAGNKIVVDSNTVGGIVTSSSTVYYWESTSSTTVGSVSTGEIVSVLGGYNGWYYIEYNVNTSYGRKRGFVPANKVSIFTANQLNYEHYNLHYVSNEYGNWTVPSNKTVYGLPRSGAPSIGTVYANEVVYVISTGVITNNQVYYFIRYTVDSTGQYKSGYIIP